MPLKAKGVDTLVLGCTHYPLLKSVIREVMGPNVFLIDSAKQVAKVAKEILAAQGLLTENRDRRKAAVEFFVSDEPENFARVGERFLKIKLKKVRKVSSV